MKKAKKLTTIGLSALICMSLMSPTFAAETNSAGLNSMLNAAYDANTSYKILGLQLDREKDDYETSNAISVALLSNYDIDEVFTYDDKVKTELTPLQETKNYLDKQYEILVKENEIDYTVKDHFYSYFNLEEDLKSKKEYYEFMDDKYSAKEKELEVGQIAQLEFDKFVESYKSAFLDYLKAQNELNRKVREINVYIGQDPNTSLKLIKSDMVTPTLGTYDLEKVYASILEHSYQIDAIEKNIEIKKAELSLKSRFKGFGETQIEMALLEDAILELESSLEDMKRTLKYDLYKNYNNALISLEEIAVKQLEYDVALRSYEIDELKYDNGLMSLIDLSESRRSFETSYFNINDAKLSHYLVVETLNNFIEANTRELTVE